MSYQCVNGHLPGVTLSGWNESHTVHILEGGVCCPYPGGMFRAYLSSVCGSLGQRGDDIPPKVQFVVNRSGDADPTGHCYLQLIL